jgi:hypothetical protein
VDASVLFPYSFLAATVDDGDVDPNSSTAMFDNSAPHYTLAKIKFSPLEPNLGGFMTLLHGNIAHWQTYGTDYEADDNAFMLEWIDGLDYEAKAQVNLNPPNYTEPDKLNGFWVLLQLDVDDPNGTGDPNDPNNHWLRAAVWNEGKFDWDGQWTIQTPITAWDPNSYTYWTEGLCGISVYGSEYTGPVSDCDAKYDDLEVRWGTFTNVSHTLHLIKIKSEGYGTVAFDPDLLDDGNNIDPNDYLAGDRPAFDELRRYTNGTEVVLTATPAEGRGWKKWKIWDDPNQYPDSNYVTDDTNSVLYLTMDTHYVVEAIFSCSADSSMMPPIGMVLLALASWVVVRRAS